MVTGGRVGGHLVPALVVWVGALVALLVPALVLVGLVLVVSRGSQGVVQVVLVVVVVACRCLLLLLAVVGVGVALQVPALVLGGGLGGATQQARLGHCPSLAVPPVAAPVLGLVVGLLVAVVCLAQGGRGAPPTQALLVVVVASQEVLVVSLVVLLVVV